MTSGCKETVTTDKENFEAFNPFKLWFREIDERLNVRAEELTNDFERKKQEIMSAQNQVEQEINKTMEKIKIDLGNIRKLI